MQTQLKAWGNSQGIRIPKKMLEMLSIQENDVLHLEIVNNGIFVQKEHRHRTLEERAAEYGGELLLSDEIDWGESIGNEVW